MKREDDYLPLFLSSNDPFVVCIVDNKLVLFDILGGSYHGAPKYAYYLLGKLATSSETVSCIPEEILEKHLKYFKKANVKYPCLCGSFAYDHCIAVLMVINQKSGTHCVRFKDFAYIVSHDNPYCSMFNLESEIELSLDDTFLLLGNICAGASITLLDYISDNESFDLEQIKTKINAYYESKYRNEVKNHQNNKYVSQLEQRSLKENEDSYSKYHFYQTDLFRFDYLAYIRKQLLEGRITPKKILRLSGAAILAFLSDLPVVKTFIETCIDILLSTYDALTFNAKICYATLLLICAQDYSARFPKLAKINFFEQPQTKASIIAKLEKECYKNIYRPKETVENFDGIYLKYLGRKTY